MPGQGVIVGVGTIDYPAELQGADERALGELGVTKVVTVTSTYDHRIIQGAESGLFLKARPRAAAWASTTSTTTSSASLGVPYEEVHWRRDVSPINREEAMLHKQMQVATLIRVHRVRGHLIADLDPLALERAEDARRARPRHLRPHHLGPRPRVPHRRRGRARTR